MAAKKKTPTGRESLSIAIENALRTGKKAQHAKVDEVAARAELHELVAAVKALEAREMWPSDIHALAGQERALFLQRRATILGSTFASALKARAEPEAETALLELVESHDEGVRDYASAIALGGTVEEEAPPASKRVLERLAGHLAAGDPLCGAAAVAAHLIGAGDVGARLAALDDGAAAFRLTLSKFVALARRRVPLDKTIWDLLRKHYGANIIVLSEELEARAPADVLVHALTTTDRCDASILIGLKLRADETTVPVLRAALPRVQGRPVAKKLEELVKELTSSPRVARTPLPKVAGVVATDGGPILLGSKRALAEWQGSPPDARAEGDYHDACNTPPFGVVARSGEEIVVLRARVADLVQPGDASIWLLLEGTLEDAWVERDALRFEALDRSVEGKDLVALDAAYPLSLARGEADRLLSLPTTSGAYSLEHGSDPDGYVSILRLRRAK